MITFAIHSIRWIGAKAKQARNTHVSSCFLPILVIVVVTAQPSFQVENVFYKILSIIAKFLSRNLPERKWKILVLEKDLSLLGGEKKPFGVRVPPRGT